MQRKKLGAVALVAAGALGLAACSGDDTTGPPAAPTAPAAAAGSDLDLSDVCPETVVVQTDWFAESEYGFLYQLLGPNYQIDTEKKLVRGPLVAQGQDTGVDIEVRFGGPAIGYTQVSAQMYIDKEITLGLVSTDEAIQNSKEQPTKAVFAPFEISPIMIMWDKEKYPNFHTLVDVGQSNTKVLYYETDTYMQYLLGVGILKEDQVDGSYDGSQSRWVAEDGAIAEGGFATSEPYILSNELGNGKSYNVDLQLIHDTGYPMYGQGLSIRPEDSDKLAPCLQRLVPVVQHAQADFLADPTHTNEIIIDAVEADHNSVWSYSPGMAEFAVKTLKDRGLVSNGGNDTVGDMDQTRIQRMIDVLRPIYAGQNKELKPGLTPADLFTNDYIEASIGIS